MGTYTLMYVYMYPVIQWISAPFDSYMYIVIDQSESLKYKKHHNYNMYYTNAFTLYTLPN